MSLIRNRSADDDRIHNLHQVSNDGPPIAPCSQPDNASDYFGPPLLPLSAASLYVPSLNARTVPTLLPLVSDMYQPCSRPQHASSAGLARCIKLHFPTKSSQTSRKDCETPPAAVSSCVLTLKETTKASGAHRRRSMGIILGTLHSSIARGPPADWILCSCCAAKSYGIRVKSIINLFDCIEAPSKRCLTSFERLS